MAKKKPLLQPKSKLGLDRKQPICFNCMFWHKKDGLCPWFMEVYDYNHRCKTRKIFRYDFDLSYTNQEF